MVGAEPVAGLLPPPDTPRRVGRAAPARVGADTPFAVSGDVGLAMAVDGVEAPTKTACPVPRPVVAFAVPVGGVADVAPPPNGPRGTVTPSQGRVRPGRRPGTGVTFPRRGPPRRRPGRTAAVVGAVGTSRTPKTVAQRPDVRPVVLAPIAPPPAAGVAAREVAGVASVGLGPAPGTAGEMPPPPVAPTDAVDEVGEMATAPQARPHALPVKVGLRGAGPGVPRPSRHVDVHVIGAVAGLGDLAS